MPSASSRLLTLLSLLQTRRDWPGAALAERLQISDRTVRRDVDRLREMGYRITATMGPDGGYRLDAGTELPPLLFDDDQVIALAIALTSTAVLGVGIEEAALRALTTMRQVMPSRLRHRLASLDFTALATRAGEARDEPVSADTLVALSMAVRAREVVRFDYANARAEPGSGLPAGTAGGATESAAPSAPRRVEPHHLVAAQGRWYLVAWDLERADWRLFRADRVVLRIPNGPRFTPRPIPGGDVAAFVETRFTGSQSGQRWPCTGTVILERAAAAVHPFAGDGVVEALGTDRCRVTTGSWSWIALAASFGRFDADLDVVGPPELAAAFAQLASRYALAAGSAVEPAGEARG